MDQNGCWDTRYHSQAPSNKIEEGEKSLLIPFEEIFMVEPHSISISSLLAETRSPVTTGVVMV